MKYIHKEIKCKCPICKNDKGEILWETNSSKAAQHYLLKENDERKYHELVNHIEILWGGEKVEVVSCLNCGLCYSNPFVAGDEKFYTLAYDRSNYPAWKWEFQVTLDYLKSKTKEFKILEIGAGNGTFIKSIKDKYTSRENIFCTEYSKYGLREIENIGVNFYNNDVRNIEFKNKFDVICLFQVLEHQNGLDELFHKLNDLLNRNSDLFIAVPNYSFIEFIEKNNILLDMPPNHVSRWTKKSFQIIAARFNWKVVSHKNEPSNWFANAKLIAVYYFLKKSQLKGTFANLICSKQYSKSVNKLLKIACIFIYSFSLGKLFYNLKSQNIGNSQWVHFSKK